MNHDETLSATSHSDRSVGRMNNLLWRIYLWWLRAHHRALEF